MLQSDNILKEGWVKVSELHSLYYIVIGKEIKNPIIFIHGGPGGSSVISYTKIIDLNYFCCIFYDQRGCGKSKPKGELAENDIDNHIEDIEKLRLHLNLAQIYLYGESWGTTLAILYGIKYSKGCLAFILKSVWLARMHDIENLFWNSKNIYPQEHEILCSLIESHTGKPIKNCTELIDAAFMLTNKNESQTFVQEVAYAWVNYEFSISSIKSKLDENNNKLALPFKCYSTGIISIYFFKNYLPINNILESLSADLCKIKCWIIHGRFDIICPLEQAYSLHKIWKESKLNIVQLGSHSHTDEAILLNIQQTFEELKNLDNYKLL